MVPGPMRNSRSAPRPPSLRADWKPVPLIGELSGLWFSVGVDEGIRVTAVRFVRFPSGDDGTTIDELLALTAMFPPDCS